MTKICRTLVFGHHNPQCTFYKDSVDIAQILQSMWLVHCLQDKKIKLLDFIKIQMIHEIAY